MGVVLRELVPAVRRGVAASPRCVARPEAWVTQLACCRRPCACAGSLVCCGKRPGRAGRTTPATSPWGTKSAAPRLRGRTAARRWRHGCVFGVNNRVIWQASAQTRRWAVPMAAAVAAVAADLVAVVVACQLASRASLAASRATWPANARAPPQAGEFGVAAETRVPLRGASRATSAGKRATLPTHALRKVPAAMQQLLRVGAAVGALAVLAAARRHLARRAVGGGDAHPHGVALAAERAVAGREGSDQRASRETCCSYVCNSRAGSRHGDTCAHARRTHCGSRLCTSMPRLISRGTPADPERIGGDWQ